MDKCKTKHMIGKQNNLPTCSYTKIEEIERRNAIEIQTTGNTFAGGVQSGRSLRSFILISVSNLGREASKIENVLDRNARKAKKKNKKTFRIFVIVAAFAAAAAAAAFTAAFEDPVAAEVVPKLPVTAAKTISNPNKTNPIKHASAAIEKMYLPISSNETGP